MILSGFRCYVRGKGGVQGWVVGAIREKQWSRCSCVVVVVYYEYEY